MTKEQVTEVIRRLQKNDPLKELAKRESIHIVIAYKNVGDPDTRPELLKRPMIRWLKENRKMSCKELADLFRCAKSTVWKYCSDQNKVKKTEKKEKKKEVPAWLLKEHREMVKAAKQQKKRAAYSGKDCGSGKMFK